MDGKTERTFIISDEFSLLTDTLLTGVRFPGAKPGGKLTIKSITFHNPNGKDGGETPVDPPVEQPAEPVERASASQGGVGGIWLRCDVDGNYPDYGVVFNANKPFTSISSHMFWASNPVAGTGTVNANIIVKLYKFAGTYADSVAGTPVAEATLSGVEGDNQLQKGFSAEGTNATLVPYDGENQGFKFQLKEAAPAGQYVVVVENDAAAGSYIVLPSTKKAEDRNYDKEYIAYYFGGSEANEAWRFLVNFNDGGDFAKLADDTTPETPTETSDMTMVLFIVAAAAIVLVVLLLKDKSILITGSAGSIGSEIVRQIAEFNPRQMVLIDQAETPQHDCRLMMASQYPDIKAETIVTSICNKRHMETIFRKYHPDYVFHAAAYKHVPMMEDNPCESIQNNVEGTKIMADLAVKYGVKKFVMISTDKAVNPTNVMGCSKRICE
ncbi:MAG: polysaccharide biosynthesis protein, partial [Clostridia bacterium]|nr:polysaccharide biosynthesis protein [Clostridia bacterium]